MKLFYTGATKFLDAQPLPYKSLGGNISSSQIPNHLEGNLFDSISKYTIWNTKGMEYRAIGILNDGAATLTGLKVWVVWNSSEDSDSNNIDSQYAEIGLGYQSPIADSCGDISIELLPTAQSRPYNTTLVETYTSQGAALTLPDIEPGMYLGLFISRRLLPVTKQPLSQDAMESIASGELELAPLENFDLYFSWT